MKTSPTPTKDHKTSVFSFIESLYSLLHLLPTYVNLIHAFVILKNTYAFFKVTFLVAEGSLVIIAIMRLAFIKYLICVRVVLNRIPPRVGDAVGKKPPNDQG